jgi:hypothetical protein
LGLHAPGRRLGKRQVPGRRLEYAELIEPRQMFRILTHAMKEWVRFRIIVCRTA